jgi:hypothetical protein
LVTEHLVPVELVVPHQMSGPTIRPFVGRVIVSVYEPDDVGGVADVLLNVGAHDMLELRAKLDEQPPQLVSV